MEADVLVVGGGIGGLSLAAFLPPELRTLVVEAEGAPGYHASGRSAAFSHFGIGNPTIRALTAHSREWLEAKGLAQRAPALFIATREMLPALDRLEAQVRPFAPDAERIGAARALALFPLLRTGPDDVVEALLQPGGLRIDAAALLETCRRRLSAEGGTLLTGAPVERIERRDDGWRVWCRGHEPLSAGLIVNAAGAWADRIAAQAGVRPLGLRPLRRTMILLDAPPGARPHDWPFVKTAEDDFYILFAGGRLAASPVDEVDSEPGDAQPEDYDIALAAAKVERYTTLPVTRIPHKWAGLRTFAPDRSPVLGFDPDEPAFFWCAGQGGFGLQTAPALAEAGAAMLTGTAWPAALAERGIGAEDLAPGRLRNG